MTLAHTVLPPPEGGPGDGYMVFLHGILGSRANWRSFAKALMRKRDLGGILVDLRMHGDSQGLSPPHTVEAAAADLVALLSTIRLDAPVTGVLGHSFGGKVAIAFARDCTAGLRELWIIDAPPGRVDGGGVTEEVLAALRDLPPSFATRTAFVDALGSRGISDMTARWLAMNLRRGEQGEAFRFGLDLEAVHALISDFHGLDLWPALASPRPGLRTHLVIGGRSSALDGHARARARSLSESGQLAVHTLAHAGHWVHVDDAEGLVALMSSPAG